MKKDGQGYLYILSNWAGNVLYVGVTNDLKRRIYEHKHKLCGGFTSDYNVDKSVYYEAFDSIEIAIQREKQINQVPGEKRCCSSLD